MQTTKVSSKGQVIIPKALRDKHQWQPGQELVATDMGNSILLTPTTSFPETKLEDVMGCLNYQGLPQTLENMEAAIQQGVEASWYGSC